MREDSRLHVNYDPWQIQIVHCLAGLLFCLSFTANTLAGVYPEKPTRRTLVIGDARIELTIVHRGDRRHDDKLTEWIQYGLDALTHLYGRFPLPEARVVIFANGPDNEVVPWGEVKRAGISTIHLYVDETRSLGELIRDWTLIHELSHLIHPYLGRDGRWFSEGIATYYQNVLQARVGTLSPRRAWQKLHEGFERGRDEVRDGRTLLNASENMHRNRDYMRVYWSGTAISLLADLRLRQEGGSLDRTMLKFRECCLPARHSWNVTDLVRKLDELSGSTVFRDLYQRYIHIDSFPVLADAYEELGLTVKNGRVIFTDQAEHTDIRTAIMEGGKQEIPGMDQ